MKIASTIQQVNKTKSQNAAGVKAANKGTNNNANNSAAVSQSTVAKSDTVTLSKKSVTLAAKTALKSEPNVEKAFGRQPNEENVGHRLGVALETKKTTSQSSGNGHGNRGSNGNSNAVSSMSSLSNNFKNALDSYRGVQKAGIESNEEIDHVL